MGHGRSQSLKQAIALPKHERRQVRGIQGRSGMLICEEVLKVECVNPSLTVEASAQLLWIAAS